MPEGNVIRTDPGAGASVEPGSGVTIVVSTGPEDVQVPDVTGLSEDNARGLLQGFDVQVSDENTLDPTQDGTVASQNPPGGSTVEPGSTINLVVYRFRAGEEPPPGGGGGGGGDGD